MSQTTLDDELFDEAAGELEADVEAALEEARAALPDADELWAVETDNVLGVLNGLRADLTAEDASEQLREARKWYEMGRRADAFEDDGPGAEIEAVEELFEQLEAAKEQVSALTSTLPEVKSALEEFEEG
ncbi:MAG: DUF5790 family protein [Halobacteriales archaeon]